MERLLLNRQAVAIEHQALRIHLRNTELYCEPDKGGEFIKIRLKRGKPQRDTWRVAPSLLLQGHERTDVTGHPFELIHTSNLHIGGSGSRIQRDAVFVQAAVNELGGAFLGQANGIRVE